MPKTEVVNTFGVWLVQTAQTSEAEVLFKGMHPAGTTCVDFQ